MEKTFKTTDVNELKEMLKKDIIEFEFIKKDGSVRTAKGTLMAEHLPALKENLTKMSWFTLIWKNNLGDHS